MLGGVLFGVVTVFGDGEDGVVVWLVVLGCSKSTSDSGLLPVRAMPGTSATLDHNERDRNRMYNQS